MDIMIRIILLYVSILPVSWILTYFISSCVVSGNIIGAILGVILGSGIVIFLYKVIIDKIV